MNIKRTMLTAESPQLDLTPLVDTIFLLIIFFVFAIPNAMMPLGINVSLPEISGAERVERTRLEITVSAEDRIFVGNEQAGMPELLKKVENFAAAGGTAVSIKGDVSSTLGRVLAVYGACKNAGITKISVLTGVEASGDKSR